MDDTAVQWVPISLNLAVHVVMYAYYALATLGMKCPWKHCVTALQIAQFAIDVPCCMASQALRLNADLRLGWLRDANTHCRGSHRAAVVGIALLGTYLALFVDLYRKSYKQSAPAWRKGHKVKRP